MTSTAQQGWVDGAFYALLSITYRDDPKELKEVEREYAGPFKEFEDCVSSNPKAIGIIQYRQGPKNEIRF